jgi:CRISPR-associated protein Cas1
MIFVQYGQIDIPDGAFVVVDKIGSRVHIPVGSVACIMLEPDTREARLAKLVLLKHLQSWCLYQ